MDITYSLIIPHYNIPHLLKRLLDTIPKRDDLQVIVVDDCSTKLINQLTRLKKEYNCVEWYTTGSNGGGGKARNIGLEHAVGKYVLFADADDFFLPSIYSILEKYKYEEYDMIIYSAISLNSDSYEVESRASELNNWISIYQKNPVKGTDKLKYVFGEPWCRLINRDLIKKFDISFQEVKCHNDTKFTYQVGHHCESLRVEPTVGYVITHRNDSIVNTKFNDRYEIEVKVFTDKQKYYLENKISEHVGELYYPLVHDIIRGKFSRFLEKYKYIKRVSSGIPLQKMLMKQIIIAIKEKMIRR